jgi:hypothetical protein
MGKWQCIGTLRSHLDRFLHSKRGNIATLFALLAPIMIGGIGLGAETSYWYFTDLKLQAAADAAAYAGAIEKRSGSNTTNVTAAATDAATQNGFNAGGGTVTVNSPPTSGAYQTSNAVEVILDQKIARSFTAVFSSNPVDEGARAVARFQTASKACILALDPSASAAILFSGNTGVNLIGCSVMSDSIATDALDVQGSASLSVDCIISAGGVSLTSSAQETQCASPQTQAPPAADPYADVPAPSPSGNCIQANTRSNGTARLNPGYYCRGLSLKGAVTLNSGVYYISGGDFQINANASVTGSGITIYLAAGSTVTINGTAYVNLSAPTSGTYAGILFFGDRSASTSALNTFNGTAGSKLTGAIYFASEAVRYLGNFSGTSGCTQVVADTIEWSGSTTINQNCSSLGMRDIPASQVVSLVE